jgi:hypothetical protein
VRSVQPWELPTTRNPIFMITAAKGLVPSQQSWDGEFLVTMMEG